MPLVLFIVCVGIIAALIAIGWRQRWDPRPQELPPRTLRTAREELEREAPPRWLWVSFAVGAALPILGYPLAWAFGRRWLGAAGFVGSFALVLAVQFAAGFWAASRQKRGWPVAVRPVLLVIGMILAIGTGSVWWILVAMVLSVLISLSADRLERLAASRKGP